MLKNKNCQNSFSHAKFIQKKVTLLWISDKTVLFVTEIQMYKAGYHPFSNIKIISFSPEVN